MYRIENKADFIRNIQKLLNINETGIYDENTRKSVAEHQKSFSIPDTGAVDYDTFISIYASQKIELESIESDIDSLFMPNFPYKEGDFNENIGVINAALKNLFNTYTLESRLPKGNYYGKDTVLAVREIRKIFLLPISDTVDARLFKRMIKELNIIEIKNSLE